MNRTHTYFWISWEEESSSWREFTCVVFIFPINNKVCWTLSSGRKTQLCDAWVESKDRQRSLTFALSAGVALVYLCYASSADGWLGCWQIGCPSTSQQIWREVNTATWYNRVHTGRKTRWLLCHIPQNLQEMTPFDLWLKTAPLKPTLRIYYPA